MKEVRYGRKEIDGKMCGVCVYRDDEDNEIIIIAPPYEALKVYRNGKRIPVQSEHAMMWTEVSAWLGMDQTLAELSRVKE